MTKKPRSGSRRAKAEVPARRGVDWAFVERVLQCTLLRVLYLHGPPGVGKTWAAYHLAPNPNGVLAVSLTEDTPAMELRGHYIQTEHGMKWQDGNFVRAMRRGATLSVSSRGASGQQRGRAARTLSGATPTRPHAGAR